MFENAALFLTGLGEIWFAGYAYTNGRLFSVTSGTNSAEYSYLAKSPLVTNIVFKQNGTTRMTTTKSYDLLNRLTSIQSINSQPSTINSFAYTYNSANQRTAVTNADNSRWAYGYDKLGQVTSGKKYWSDSSAVAGQQFDYTYDDIGNRRTATRDTRQSEYTVNLLNQHTQRTVPGYVNVIGEATNAATVTVNFTAASRKGDYFRAELPVNNSSPLWQALTNLAVLNQGTNADIISTNLGNVYVPAATEAFAHDADGNLTNDGRFSYAWDAENRLTNITRISSAPSGSKVKLDLTYDPQWRRTQKIVSTWGGSAYVAQSTNKFVYDGWNLVAVLDYTNGLVQSFTWGLDASGSMQGAGGVGGLLATTIHQGTNAGTYFCCYDGNHNVAALVNASNGVVAGQWEYDPFLGLLRATGPLAFANPFLGSTKFYDWETGLYYYGYRYYDPSTGRWLSRDPIQERGGMNLYEFGENDPITKFDRSGLDIFRTPELLLPPAESRCNPVSIPCSNCQKPGKCCEDGKLVDKVRVLVINRSEGRRTGLTGGHIDLVLPQTGLIGFYGDQSRGFGRKHGIYIPGCLNSTSDEWMSGPTARLGYTLPPNMVVIGPGVTNANPLSTICVLDVCPEEARNMAKMAALIDASPGHFQIIGRNCSSVACQILGAGGVMSGGIRGIDNPQHLLDQLWTKHGATCFTGYVYWNWGPDGSGQLIPDPMNINLLPIGSAP